MKKLFALLLALVLALSLAACGGNAATAGQSGQGGNDGPAASSGEAGGGETSTPAEVELTLWAYAIGDWGKPDALQPLLDQFKADTGIRVKVEALAYADGDAKVDAAIEGRATPDLIMEGPERLVANWGAKGYLVDISDLWDDASRSEIYGSILDACFDASGASYEYPLCMTAHCMGINLDRFKAVGADQYIDMETRTWTADGFFHAVQALYGAGHENVAIVFCKDQGGDQGTRALVNNLYDGKYTNPEHTAYTADSPENQKALQALLDTDGIRFDPASNGGDEIQLFRQGVLDMAFCWNGANQANTDAGNEPGRTNSGEEILCVAFPSEDGVPELCGGIWGFGIFDNGDPAKIEAAKTFIRYMANSEHTPEAVKLSSFFGVRDTVAGQSLSAIFADDPILSDYTVLLPYLGDYYNVIGGWTAQRAEWWNMLQRVAVSGDVAAETATFVANANAGIG